MDRKAFSLIELLVVVGIIGVLLAILLPSMDYAITQAQRAQCMSNTRAQHAALIQYAMDHQRKFPPHDDFSPDYHRSGNNPNIVLLMRGTYVQNTGILICPIAKDVPNQSNNQYKSNDWQAQGVFGGWDTQASFTNTAYMWLVNFTGTRMFDAVPAPPDPQAGPLEFPPQVNSFQMIDGELPPARSLAHTESNRAYITHKINFFNLNENINLQDISHFGRGEFQKGTPYNDYDSTETVVGFGDGHAITRPREQIKPRMVISGHYPDDPGTIGTFLW